MAKSNKIRKIIVHAGFHKTGTTSIQASLADERNQSLLEGMGYVYPTSLRRNHSESIYSMFSARPDLYYINIRNKLSLEEVLELNQAYERDFDAEIDQKTGECLVISGEDISGLDTAGLARFKVFLKKRFNSAQISVVVYVRHPIALFISNYQEQIKNGTKIFPSTQNSDEMLPVSNKLKIENLISAFGEESVRVFSFEDAVNDLHGPVGHFLSAIGIARDEINLFEMTRVNKSLSELSLRIISFINENEPLFIDNEVSPNRKNSDTYALHEISGNVFYPKESSISSLRAKTHDDVKYILRKFGIDYTEYSAKAGSNYLMDISDVQTSEIEEAYYLSPPLIQDAIEKYLSQNISNIKFKSLFIKLNKGEHTFSNFK
jgi:hypothetical protein